MNTREDIVMKKLNKIAYGRKATIEGFAKKCDCICGDCACYGPDKWHVLDQIAKKTSKNSSTNKKR